MEKTDINTELERILNAEVVKNLKVAQEQLEKKIKILKDDIEAKNRLLPQTTELLLKHLDIVLETCKTFLIVSSTVLAAALAIKDQSILNIDINRVQTWSIIIALISALFMAAVLLIRNSSVGKIIKQLARIESQYTEIYDISREVLNLTHPNTIKESQEKAKTILKNENPLKDLDPALEKGVLEILRSK